MITYVHYGSKKFDKSVFRPIQNRVDGRGLPWGNKPLDGGLWASADNAKFGWRDWNRQSQFRECREDNCFRFTLDTNARILHLDNDDIAKVELAKFGAEELSHGVLGVLDGIDFESICQQYDAIEFNRSADGRLYWTLYGWDCDCILVLNPDVVMEINN